MLILSHSSGNIWKWVPFLVVWKGVLPIRVGGGLYSSEVQILPAQTNIYFVIILYWSFQERFYKVNDENNLQLTLIYVRY